MPVDRDVVIQLRPTEAEIVLRSLHAAQDMLETTSEFLPAAASVIDERTQELSKLRILMRRVRDAPSTGEYLPREIGGVVLIRFDTGKVVAWGPNMEHISGWTSLEMLGNPGWQALGLSESRIEAFLERLSAEHVIQQEVNIPTKWGKLNRIFYRAELCENEYVLAHIWPV